MKFRYSVKSNQVVEVFKSLHCVVLKKVTATEIGISAAVETNTL